MADAIEILIDEHKLIEMMLGSLGMFAERLGEEPENERATVSRYAEFFRKFVDECHHGKEEGYLFRRMSAYGFSNEAGPISAMLSEQGEGREHLNALAGIGKGAGRLTARERTLVRGHALGYISRIESHMKREDDILFPVARHALPPFVLDELTAEFEAFDGNAANGPVLEDLMRVARELMAKYSPKTGSLDRS